MNKKGFAITGIIYTLMVLFIILIIALLAMFNDRKNLLDELRERVLNNINTSNDVVDAVYKAKNFKEEYTVKLRGYYDLEVTSTDGSTFYGTFYFYEGEKIYISVGSSTFNNESTSLSIGQIIDNKIEEVNILEVNKKINNQISYKIFGYDNRVFLNTKIETKNSEAQVKITYGKNTKQSSDLKKVRYIKECLYSNSLKDEDGKDSENKWAEIMAIKNGKNYALGREVKGDVKEKEIITDGDINTITTSKNIAESDSCVTIDLTDSYDLDYIYLWHNYSDNVTYYERKLYVSSDDKNYIEIDNYEQKESKEGIIISSFNISRVLKIGDVLLSVKEFDGATWARIFHHNNRNGNVLWDSNAQVLANNGYSTYYKISALKFLESFRKKDGSFELLLEYPDESNEYNRWKQKSNFISAVKVEGYSATKIGLTSAIAPFKGLIHNEYNDTLISGTTGNYYSIGARNSINNGILGYNGDVITGTVDLWIRIDDYLNEVKK